MGEVITLKSLFQAIVKATLITTAALTGLISMGTKAKNVAKENSTITVDFFRPIYFSDKTLQGLPS